MFTLFPDIEKICNGSNKNSDLKTLALGMKGNKVPYSRTLRLTFFANPDTLGTCRMCLTAYMVITGVWR